MNKNVFLNAAEKLKNNLFKILLLFSKLVLLTPSEVPSLSLFLHYVKMLCSIKPCYHW
jgi:hypothetical protein